tara:strand:+ start:181 stop:1059 length:879 start_codon:yes stop_codon:yes gene_type:complete
MAETLSYQQEGTVTSADNLSAEEQESLKVGESISQQEEQLLAGKYKNAQELEKAYIELQGKLGKQEEKTETAETAESNPDSIAPENAYQKDGSVNYDKVTETYGSAVTDKLQEAGVDPWSIADEFHKNDGQYTPEMVSQLTKAGFSEDAVKAYFRGAAAEGGYTTPETEPAPITDSDISSIKQSVGGDKEYAQVIKWAKDNLDESANNAFNDTVNTGSISAIKLAVAGLKAEYDKANGVEGRMVTGKTAPPNNDVFRSQQELVRAMSDPRYDNDPAYRQDIIEKLDRSDINF